MSETCVKLATPSEPLGAPSEAPPRRSIRADRGLSGYYYNYLLVVVVMFKKLNMISF